MKRRDFIKSSLALYALGSYLPTALLGSKNRFSYRNSNIDSDRIVILIKMNGGNDGLNTLIPFQSSSYYQERPAIAIPIEQSLPITDTLALHPALENWQRFFEQQRLAIIQGVGYDNGNLSHFRSSDIWDTGSNEDIELSTGWLGRLLELEFPGFPDNAPEHPLAIQYNSANLLEFKTETSNTGLYLYDPNTMYSIISGNYIDNLNSNIPETYGGDELAFIRELDHMSFNYSQIISEAAQNAPNTIMNYPNTNIGQQFKITAQLIAGGLSTPFYRLYQNGYDTHVEQLYSHELLLSDLSDAINVFFNEMDALELLDRIIIVTTSEFGRRVYENASEGTDHGTSAPVFIFGSGLNGGVFGDDPDLTTLDNNGNLHVQYDYRQIYTTIMKNWLGLNANTIDQVFNDNFQTIPFLDETLYSQPKTGPNGFRLDGVYPNPFNSSSMISYTLPKDQSVTIRLFDMTGRVLKVTKLGKQKAGSHLFKLSGKGLPSGSYIAQVEIKGSSLTQKISLIK